MQQACKVASYQSLEKEEMDMISAREKAEQDALAREHYVWSQGIEEGIEIVVKRMHAKGKSIQEIGELIDLREDEIRALIK